MYNEELRVKIEGLYTSPNQFSEVPEGATLIASNVNLDRDSVLATRRGFKQFGASASTDGDITSEFSYKQTLLEYAAGTLKREPDIEGDPWIAYSGTYNVPDDTLVGARIRSFQQSKNFYFTTSDGVQKLDALTATPVPSGAPPALGGTGVTTGSSGWMPTNKAVAYRIVWGYRDANGNLIMGAASDRIVVTNTSGGNRDVSLTFTVPIWSSLDTTWFYQIYRSDQAPTATEIPPDDYQQIDEKNPTSGELSSRTITYTDITPDELRQAFLYSGAQQGSGAASGNYPPPFCKDLCSYSNFAFYANTREPHEFNITLQAVGPSLGLQVNDTVTFVCGLDTFTVTGKSSENAAAGEFKITTSGTPSQNNEATARSLAYVINLYASNTFLNAYYVSPFDDQQGQMRFEKRSAEVTSFHMNSSRTTCWNITLPTTGTNANNVSENFVFQNRVYFSKEDQPEAVTLLSYKDILDANEPILRIVPLRDGVIVFKTDGIAAITLQGGAFSVNILDNTAIVVAPNSVTAFNNLVYYFARNGLSRIGPNGSPEIISIPIKKDLDTISSAQYPNFPELTFGVGYESDLSYYLFTVTTPSDTYCTMAYRYNTDTNAWTTLDRPATCGIVNPADNKMYLGGPLISGEAFVYQERKTGTNEDYADEQYDVQIISFDGLEIVLDSVANVTERMTLRQGEVEAIIESIDAETNTVTVQELDTWFAGDATLFKPIRTVVRTSQFSAKNPIVMKQMVEISLIFETPNFDQITISFISDYNSVIESVLLEPDPTGRWGLFNWGEIPWGGEFTQAQRLRTLIPKSAQRVNWLLIDIELEQCFTSFSLEAVGVMFRVQGHRQRR